MHGNIKDINFIKFDFLDEAIEKVSVKCNIEFIAQVPEDVSKLERAVLITFSAKADDDVMHFVTQARVIFGFAEENVMPDKEEAFLDEYYLDAYRLFKEKVSVTLNTLGVQDFPFPDTI